ncbi:Ig-like domain-containing protein [Paenibacillus sp. VCA1]|uniref:Ig-like domain-containing protein n=1 Tax=Paenibacillus sp. VCA1 TaxID=3039148 RepID=UPI002871041A|nr:Ig-like domain-containing protein [Paenibacillus sp. VCA1]MDR9853655.1 Ig-like domain-containing protein [Paenibacillus sp. VCA1]
MMFLIFSLVFTGIGASLGTPISYAASSEVYVASGGNDTTGDGTKKFPYATLSKAYLEINDGGTIFLLDNITLSAQNNSFLEINQAKNITITTADGVVNPAVIKRGTPTGAQKDTLINLTAGGLTLKNIIIDGNSDPSWGRIVNVDRSGKLFITEGAVLQNNYSKFPGSAVYLMSSTAVVEMTGGEIRGNSYASSGTVLIGGGTFTMTGGLITDNIGGGVDLQAGTFNLSGDASITGNTIVESGQQKDRNVNLQGNTFLTLKGAFTGKAGITAQNRMTAGSKFGQAIAGDLAGLENLIADNYPLFAVYGVGNALLWQSLPTVTLDQPSGDKVFIGKPEFAGTATPGATVKVKIDDNITLTATADANGNWSVKPDTDLPNDIYNIEITATNYDRTSAPVLKTLEVDTTPPAVALEQPSGDKVFTGKPEFAGTATPGATVKVKINDNITLTTIADANGNWSVKPDTDLPDDTYNVEITATKDGKTSTPVSKTVEVDTLAPAVAMDQPSGEKVFTGKPEFAGTATPGATVTVKVNDNITLTTTADANGNWSVKPDTDLPNGTYNVEVTATKDTKTSAPVSKTIEVDTTAPTVTLEQPNGDTVFTGKPEFAGTATPGATVMVKINDNITLTTIADANGNWSVKPDMDLPNGIYNVEVTATKDTKTSMPVRKDITIEAVDKSALEKKANEIDGKIIAGELTDSDYTQASWDNLKRALDEAERVLNDPTATQEEVDQALTALEQAEKDLVKLGGELGELNHVGLTQDGEKEITLTPAFDPNQYKNYSGTVTNDVYGISLNPVAKYPDDTQVRVFVEGKEYLSDDWNKLPLIEGKNEIKVGVYDKAGELINEYTYVIVRESAVPANNKLESLVPSVGHLFPVFDPNQESYTMSVANSVNQLQLTPTAQDPNATIQIQVNNGEWKTVTTGELSDYLALNVGPNVITIKVTDQNGKGKTYSVTVTRASGNDNSGTDNTPTSPTPPTTDNPVKPGNIVTTDNGSNVSFASGTVNGDQATVTIDKDKLSGILADGKGHKLGISVPGKGDVEVRGLTLEGLKKITDTGSSLEIEDVLAIYPVPAGKLDVNAISKQFGNAPLSDIAVNIKIKRSADDLAKVAREKAAQGGYELLVHPVDLDLTFNHDGKTDRAGLLNGYAPKYIALPEGVDPNRITTGVIVNPDGSVFHVPTVVTKIDNRYFALINDLRSSGTYSVIWNPQDFDDVQYHWGRADVNNIAARLDLKGNGDNTFSPNRYVTRSEFAEIVVLGLGLMRQDAPQNIYPDVPSTAWYRNAVALADEFDIVRGYEDGNFKGGQQITREQGFAMIARAYRLIQSENVPSQEQIASALAPYADGATVASWAKADVAQLITSGIIQGNGPELLSPKAEMTRAEVTALIARMLKVTHLIDK